MSYKIFTHRDNRWPPYNAGLLIETRREAWYITLVGEAEHKGTNLTLTEQQLYAYKFDDERELGAVLDRLFLRAHHARLSRPPAPAAKAIG